MHLVPLGGLQAGSLLWQRGAGARVLTVVAKATFALVPGEAQLAAEQEPVREGDDHWDDDPARSIYAPSDIAPFKPHADVVLVGHAFAPRGEPVRSLVARLIVGEVNKAIEVCCDRSFTQDGALREGARITRVALRYERAAGGPDTTNPVGVRADAAPDAYGMTALPSLQPPGVSITTRADFIEPIGFGPVAPDWPPRRERVGRHAGFTPERLRREALPPDIEPGFFNCAPRDQQVESIRDNERIILENLHPEHARLVVSLPGLHPRAFVDRGDQRPQELVLRGDTLWIDTSRAIATLTWRGHVESPAPNGRILLALESPGQRLSLADLERKAGGNTPARKKSPETVTFVGADPSAAGALPFAGTTTSSGGASRLSAMAPSQAVRPAEEDAGGLERLKAIGAPPAWARTTGGLAAPASSGAPSSKPVWSRPGGPVSETFVAPPPIAAPPMQPLPAPESGPLSSRGPSSPWAGGGAAPRPPVPMAAPAPVAAPAVVRAPAPDASAPAMAMPGSATSGLGMAGSATSGLGMAGSATSGLGLPGSAMPAIAMPAMANASAAALSDAAAASELRTGTAPSGRKKAAPSRAAALASPRDVLELVWYDPRALARIRARWSALVLDLSFDELDEGRDLPPEDRAEASNRQDVFGVLDRGDSTEVSGVPDAIRQAVNERGRFTPPLVIVSGDLRFPFDEMETLKAVIAVVTPGATADKKLKETLDSVNDLIGASALQGGAGVIEKLTQQLKDQYSQSNRQLPSGYLDTQVDRSLLEQRRYQIRRVFGGEHIRALLGPTVAGAGAEPPLPAYLPRSLEETLPMKTELRVRLIAEAQMQQDQFEGAAYALRVVAVGRVLPIDIGRFS